MLALEMEKTPSSNRTREADLMEKIVTLKKIVRELEAPVGRKMGNKLGSSQNQIDVFDIFEWQNGAFCAILLKGTKAV